MKKNEIDIPQNPRQGAVVEWWTMQLHPISPYVQRHRATYYESATCAEVLGKHHAHGRAFCREWLIETWYEPHGTQSSGGRNTTNELRDWWTGESSKGVYATWEDARDAVVKNVRERCAELRASASALEKKAAELEKTPAPGPREGRRAAS
jgi:hypothetical protein